MNDAANDAAKDVARDAGSDAGEEVPDTTGVQASADPTPADPVHEDPASVDPTPEDQNAGDSAHIDPPPEDPASVDPAPEDLTPEDLPPEVPPLEVPAPPDPVPRDRLSSDPATAGTKRETELAANLASYLAAYQDQSDPVAEAAGSPESPLPPAPAQPALQRLRLPWWPAAIALVVVGALVGSWLTSIDDVDPDSNDATALQPAGSAGADGDAADSNSSGDQPAPDTVAGEPEPVVDFEAPEFDADEPVIAVAQAVRPSVVLVETMLGQGSGIVWDAGSGYIVTNHHVVRGTDQVKVTLQNGRVLDASIVGGSGNHDVAVISVDPDEEELVEAVFAPSSELQVGQLAVAIGSPFNLNQTVTTGIVSAVRTSFNGGSDPANPVPMEMVQTDASINLGNSGGALADREGRVIGMNTSIVSADAFASGNIGLGFAIPSDTVLLVAGRIVNGESLELGFLGVSSDVDRAVKDGAIVTDVIEDSPALRAGIEVGDVIVAVNGVAITEISQLSAEIKLYRPGEVVKITIERDGMEQLLTVEVELASFDETLQG